MTAASIEREILDGITWRTSARGDGAKAEFFDTAFDLFVVAERGGRVILANEAWTRVLGWELEVLSGERLFDLVHPDDLDATHRLWPAMARGSVARIENRYRCVDGSYRWLLWSAFQRGGRVYGAAKDITERKAVDRAVAEGERRAHAILDALPDGVTLIDGDGRITEANERFCAMVGLDATQVVGALPPYAWWPGGDRAELGAMLRAAMRRGRMRERATFVRAGGERFPTTIDVVGHPMRDGSPGVLCVMRDDSDRAIQGQMLKTIEKLALVASWTWDPDTDVITTTTPWQTHTTMGMDITADARMEHLIAVVADSHRQAVRDVLWEAVRTGEPRSVEYPGVADAAEQHWFSTALQPQQEAGGRVTAVLGITQNITGRRAADVRAVQAESFWRATIDSLEDQVAVLDATGTIVAVNRAWTRWSDEHGDREARIGVGTDYIAACERAPGTPDGVWIADDLRALLAGTTDRLDCEYSLHGPVKRRWCAMSGMRFEDATGVFVVIQHTDVTERKLVELAARADRDRLLEAQRVARLGAWELDVRTNMLEVSDQYPAALGGAGRAVVAVERVLEQMWEADRRRIESLLADARTMDGRVEFEWRFGPADDTHWAATRAVAVRDSDGEVTHVRGVTQDITFRRRAEQEIRKQADLLDSVDASVLATDADGTITHANAGFTQMYGLAAHEVIGTTIWALSERLGHPDPEGVRPEEAVERELHLRRPDGREVAVYLRRQPIVDDAGAFAGCVFLTVDINERIESERRLRSAHDFLDAVTDAMADGVVTLDPHGCVRYMNVAAERLLDWTRGELLGQPIELVIGHELPVSQSIVRVDDGSFARGDGTSLPVSYTASPFEAESGQRGSVVVFRDIRARKEREQQLLQQVTDMGWVNAIRDALVQDRFVLHAQPIVDVSSGETVQQELLIRMIGEDGELVPPGDFLPVAERSGLIGQIDRWVVRKALALAAAGRAIELNLSAHSIGDPDMLEFFETALSESGADPSLVVVELTETALVESPDAAQRFVHRVQALGCRFALDDFGTGYGGFTYLKRLPVDYLKIDIDFVRDLPRDPAGRTVIEAVVNLARGFGQRTIAEGVEDNETLVLLRELGVDYAQGYAIARPAPIT